MADFSQIRNFHLKVIFIIHFLGISMSSFGYWSSSAYLYYNTIFIFALLWAIRDHNNDEPVQIAIFVNGTSIVLDILLLVMCFPDSDRARERFSVAMAILHLVVRPFTTVYLTRILDERGGLSGSGISNILPGRHQGSYEDIDRNIPSNQPPVGTHAGDYDFTAAQRI